MYDSVVVSIFQKTNIAEINSRRLFDYENSLNHYFNDVNSSNFCQKYFKWFDYKKFGKNNNSFLKDFERSFYDIFF